MTWSCAGVVFWAAIASRSMQSPLLAHPSGESAPLAHPSGESAPLVHPSGESAPLVQRRGESALEQQSSDSATTARASSTREDRAQISDLEAEVVANLKQKNIPLATLADLDLSEDYLHRVAGRILRASFEENFRVVVSDATSSDARTADARGMHTTEPGANASPTSAPSRSELASAAEEQRSMPSWLVFVVPAALGALFLAGMRYAKRRAARAR